MAEQPPFSPPLTPEAPVARDRARIDQQAVDAAIRLEQLKAEYRNNPEMKLAQDRVRLAALQNDPFHLNRVLAGSSVARDEEASLQARIAVAESKLEAERLDRAMRGEKIDLPGIETTTDGELPRHELAAPVEPFIEHGLKPELLKNFLQTGKSGGPDTRETEIALAREWERRLLADPELQKRFLSGADPELRRQFDAFAIYAADPRKTPSE